MNRLPPLLALLLPLLAVGCSGDDGHKATFGVTGAVLVDGKPAEHATVVFHPVGATGPDVVKPRGTVGADGSFKLTSYDGYDGAPAGDYQVTVELWLAAAKPDQPPTNRLNAKFSRPETSGLKATVTKGPTKLEPFTLKRS